MLGAVAYMTADEKRALRENVERMSADAEIDRDAVYEAMVKGHIFINDLIHIQQMKNGMLRNIGFEPFAFEYRTKRDGGRPTPGIVCSGYRKA